MGQACCSAAPQGAPGAVSGQGVGGLFPGQGWVQASVFSLDTRRQFGTDGSTEPYFADGRLQLESFLLTGAVGVVTGLEVWAQGAVHTAKYEDVAGSIQRTGLGDVRLWVRAGPRLVGIFESDLPVWVGVRAGVKLPGSDFPLDRTVIPLSEGQADVELALEVGRVLVDGRIAVQTWVGHRWRGRNETVGVKPGDEWFGYASAAAAVGPLQVRLAAQFLEGSPYETFGLRPPSSRRELLSLYPSLATALGPGTIEVGAQAPITGRNLPTGTALTLAYTVGFGEAPLPSLDDLFPS